jgi:CheY-like chemotaxis protein
MRVLIVDDCGLVRRALRRSLARFGCVVSAAANGLQALELVEQGFVPDTITVDIDMPLMSGIVFVRSLRRDARLAHARVIMVTAQQDPSSMKLARDAGADAYVAKPFCLRTLVAALNSRESLSPSG